LQYSISCSNDKNSIDAKAKKNTPKVNIMNFSFTAQRLPLLLKQIFEVISFVCQLEKIEVGRLII
jgi:hypothetical protein